MSIVHTVKINDVLSGRGNGPNQHPGNIIFRRIVANKSEAYNRASCQKEKQKIKDEVIVQVTCNEGRFLSKRDTNGLYHILNEKQIRKKTGQALRDLKNNDANATDNKIAPSQRDIGLPSGYKKPRNNDTTDSQTCSPELDIHREQPENNDIIDGQTCIARSMMSQEATKNNFNSNIKNINVRSNRPYSKVIHEAHSKLIQ